VRAENSKDTTSVSSLGIPKSAIYFFAQFLLPENWGLKSANLDFWKIDKTLMYPKISADLAPLHAIQIKQSEPHCLLLRSNL